MALGDTDWFLEEQMVEDPVARVRFPKLAAGATLDWQGKKLYFVDDETRREFEKLHGTMSK